MTPDLSATALLKKIRSYTTANKKSATLHILLAYSGGLDSHVLLHLLSLVDKKETTVRAIYINHGLQFEAEEWSEHCRKICNDLVLPFSSIDLNLQILKGESIEEFARNARYKALSNALLPGEILLTAHHQSDQAETLLLQLFRGAGVQGLAAMPIKNEINLKEQNNDHIRPLLDYSRTDLENYAQRHDLNFIKDPSNQNTIFDRNFIRLSLMPELKKRWPSLDKTIARAANIQAETKVLLDGFAKESLDSVLTRTSSLSIFIQHGISTIDISKLQQHDLINQRLLLRYWISSQGFDNPSENKLAHIFSDVINAKVDKQPLVTWRGVELRRYQQKLYIMSPLSDHDETQVIVWSKNRNLEIPSLDIILEASLIEEHNDYTTVRFRQGGEKINIKKRGNLSLKKLFQEKQVPPWLRSRIPLIYQDEQLVKIVGID